MTLIMTVNGPESIWLLADRRLSYKGRPPKDDAHKIMFLDTTDGKAILGYAGLGATALGTEPADWMSAVLRGRNLPLEQSLAVLAEAVKNQLPRHLVHMPGDGGPTHTVMVTAFVGKEARLYTIDLAFAPDRNSYHFRATRHVMNKPTMATVITPRLGLAGTGALYLDQDKKWIRSLLRMVRANDRGHIRARAVADHLANLNYEVHLRVTDKSVGPHCIVAWRYREGDVRKDNGGHQFYTRTIQDADSPSLPSIVNGMDMHAIGSAMMLSMIKAGGVMLQEQERDELNAKLARLPLLPDDSLR